MPTFNVVADDIPAWPQNISNTILVFDQSGVDRNGHGYYTVKVDNWQETAPKDLDESIDDVLGYFIANDSFISDDSTLAVMVIKGGNQAVTQCYAYGANNTNGTDPDPLPSGIGFSLTGDFKNVNPPAR